MAEEKIKCLIIDDEELAIKVIKSYVEKVEMLQLVATCHNAFDAFNLLNKEKIDLIFLDIQMPQITGLDFLRTLKTRPQVILTTAYRDYAPEGFDLDVLDYLLKPISFTRFLKAVGKVRSIQPTNRDSPFVKRENDYSNAYIFVKSGKSMEKVCYKDVLFIESFRDFVKIHTTENEITTYLKIGYLEEKLPKEIFERVHKSYIISVPKIDAFSMSEVEIDHHHIPIGNYYKKHVLERLNEKAKGL